MSWETTVRTGHPAGDEQALARLRQQATANGMALHVSPLAGGGFHVKAVGGPPAYSPSPGYGASQQQAYGAPQQQADGAPQQAYGAPQQQADGPPHQQAYGAQQQQAYGAPQQHSAYAAAPHAHYAHASPPPQQQAPAFAAPASPAPFAAAGVYGANAGLIEGGSVGGMAAAPALGAERVSYLRKVYGLLAISAALAIGAGSLAVTTGSERVVLDDGSTLEVPLVVRAMLDDPALLYGSFGVLFMATVLAGMVSKVKGLNYAALFGVSILMGVELAPMVWVAQIMAGFGETMSSHPVRDSFAMVGAIFAGLTGYIFITRKDFSYLRATLTMGFFVVFAAALLAGTLGSEPFSLAVASVGALLAVGFLLYQTSYIFTDGSPQIARSESSLFLST